MRSRYTITEVGTGGRRSGQGHEEGVCQGDKDEDEEENHGLGVASQGVWVVPSGGDDVAVAAAPVVLLLLSYCLRHYKLAKQTLSCLLCACRVDIMKQVSMIAATCKVRSVRQ